jgi:OmpA-OmpF porin, OOP family
MCRPSKWIWGLLPLLLLGLMTFWVKSGAIEDDLASRTNTERRAEGHRWARVKMDGRELTLTGVAPTEADSDKMVEIAQSQWGVRTVVDNTELLAIADPYILTAERGEKNLVFTGFVPNREIQKRIVDAAKAANPDWRVKNEMELGRGAPENFADAVENGIGQLSRMSSGVMTLDGNLLSIQGEASNMENYAAARAVMQYPELPAGYSLSGDSSVSLPTVDPYIWSASRSVDTIRLTGYAPDEELQAEILELATEKFPTFQIDDQTAIAGGAPGNWSSAAAAILSQIGRLVEGEAVLTNTDIEISGDAVHQAAADGILQNLENALPQGFTGSAEIGIATPGEPVDLFACQDLFNGVMEREVILFDVGAATINGDSLRVLDAIVSVALRCLDGKIAILGHTDSDGEADSNRRLSEARAGAVRDTMIAAGIEANRLTAIGYGELRPLATNDTPEGKAANRRIEFRVVRIQY